MRALLLTALLLGCQADDASGSGGNHYCCTLREFCLACGCSVSETTIADAGDEAACQQLLDSADYQCGGASEADALAKCVGKSNTPTSSSRCVEWGDDSCICRDQRQDNDVPFAGTCDETGVGNYGICCQKSNGSCYCEPVHCGISGTSGLCICGVGVLFDSFVASCDGTAATCCTQDTGYCYCEDGCQNRFANRTVGSCNESTEAATCSEGELRVPNCE